MWSKDLTLLGNDWILGWGKFSPELCTLTWPMCPAQLVTSCQVWGHNLHNWSGLNTVVIHLLVSWLKSHSILTFVWGSMIMLVSSPSVLWGWCEGDFRGWCFSSEETSFLSQFQGLYGPILTWGSWGWWWWWLRWSRCWGWWWCAVSLEPSSLCIHSTRIVTA